MGERQSDGGRAGRRRVHSGRPEDLVSASGRSTPVSVEGPAGDTARLEALLASVLVREGVDAGAEQRAVAAFVAARESGAHGARTRRRDDWRASRRRFGGRSLRAVLGSLVAGCALSGVAVAGIHVAGVPDGGRSSEDTEPDRTPSVSAAPSVAPEEPDGPDVPDVSRRAEAPDASSPSGLSGSPRAPKASASATPGPEGAPGAEARCRAFERAPVDVADCAVPGGRPSVPVVTPPQAAETGAAERDAEGRGAGEGAGRKP